jgi:hypothetical protein
VTNAEIRERVIRALGLQVDTSQPELGLVDGWVYEGIIDMLARTRPNTRVINLVMQPGVAVHDMSQSVISLLDVEDSEGFLDRFTREDVVSLQKTHGRGYAYEEPLLWVSPPAAAEPKTIKAYGVLRPGKMTGDSDTPANPAFGGLAPEFHPYIVTYALWKGGEYTEHEGSGLGEKWRVQYEGQEKDKGELGVMKRILLKRVTPKGMRRRDPTHGTDALSESGSYLGG